MISQRQSDTPAGEPGVRCSSPSFPTGLGSSRMAIGSPEALRQHLQWALELEHATIPPYLCALYSISEDGNQEAAEVVRSVFMEEMLHMTLVANVLNAVGGSPRVDTPRMLPSYPTFLPHSNRAFEVSLEKFSPKAVETFMRIERPDEHHGLPEDDEFETIGQFYEAIEVGLRRLCDEAGRGRASSAATRRAR